VKNVVGRRPSSARSAPIEGPQTVRDAARNIQKTTHGKMFSAPPCQMERRNSAPRRPVPSFCVSYGRKLSCNLKLCDLVSKTLAHPGQPPRADLAACVDCPTGRWYEKTHSRRNPLAVHPSVIKRHRQSLKRRARNVDVKSKLRTLIKKARQAIDARNNQDASVQFRAVDKALGKAVRKGIIKRNTASRWLSRLARSKTSASAAS